MTDVRIVGNDVYLDGVSVAVITTPEGTSVHGELVEHLIEGDEDALAEQFEMGHDDGWSDGHFAGAEEGRTKALKEIRDGKNKNYKYIGAKQ